MALEALAEVDAGWFIDHRAIQASAQSLETDKPLPPPNRVKIRWAGKALSDLARLYQHLRPVSSDAAARVVRHLASAPDRLAFPRIGESWPL